MFRLQATMRHSPGRSSSSKADSHLSRSWASAACRVGIAQFKPNIQSGPSAAHPHSAAADPGMSTATIHTERTKKKRRYFIAQYSPRPAASALFILSLPRSTWKTIVFCSGAFATTVLILTTSPRRTEMMAPAGPVPRWRVDCWHRAGAVVNPPFDRLDVLAVVVEMWVTRQRCPGFTDARKTRELQGHYT